MPSKSPNTRGARKGPALEAIKESDEERAISWDDLVTGAGQGAGPQAVRVQVIPMEEIKFWERNPNRGTDKGRLQVRRSMEEFGFVDAGTLDRNNRLIGGNQRTAVARGQGYKRALVVEHDGSMPVYIKLKDADLEDPEDDTARRMGYALNRTQEISLQWDPQILYEDMMGGMDMGKLFDAKQLAILIATEQQRQSQFLTAAMLSPGEAEEDEDGLLSAVPPPLPRPMTAPISENVMADIVAATPMNTVNNAISGSSNPYVNVTIPVTYEQRSLILAAINRAKAKWAMATTTDAMLEICRQFLALEGVEVQIAGT